MAGRRWLQIHLLTAVLLTFVAGGLILVNLRTTLETGSTVALTTYMAGWPAISYTRVEFESDDTSHNFARWHWKKLLLNSVVALGILAASAWIFERLIYRSKYSELRAS